MKVRNRKYFLTINKNATCYKEVENTTKKLKNVNYYLITHKPNQKQEHKHLILEFKEAKSLETIKRYFTGSHIEECKEIETACKYLLHKNTKAILQNKEPYEVNHILTNNLERFKGYLAKSEKIKLNEDVIYTYIVDSDFQLEKLNDIYWITTFGNQYYRFEKMIHALKNALASSNSSLTQKLILSKVNEITRNNYYERNGQIFDNQVKENNNK